MRTLLSATLMASTFLAGSAGLSNLFVAHSQEAEPNQDPLSGTVRSVIIEGNQRIESRTIQSYLLILPGSPFNEVLLDLSVKTLFSTELFADVNIGRRGDDLVVTVVENPIINRVLFEGNKTLDSDTIREEIQAEPRGVFTLARVQADVRRIVELYRASGRFAAEVTPQYKLLDQSRVDLIFEVTEGPTTGVRSINFIGNELFSDSRLRSEIVTQQSRLWRFFSSNDNYDPDRLQFDQEVLRQFYQNRGYYDFRVVTADAAITPDQKDFYITFTIDEGRQYEFGDIRVDTNLDKLDEDILTEAISVQSGDLYKADLIEDVIDQLTAVAGINGYAFVDVIPRITPNPDTGKIDIVFALDEGPRVYIDRINIVGNTRTLDPVVRSRLLVSEGDAFNRVSIDRSRGRVLQLGYFGEVNIQEVPGESADRATLDVSVIEQPTGELSASAGFSSVDAFLIDLNISERNLLGRGVVASARISASQRNQLVDIRYQEPQFLGRNLAAGLSVFASRSDFSDVSFFESQTFGGQVNFGFPVTLRSSLSLRYRISQDNIDISEIPGFLDENGDIALTPSFDAEGNPVLNDDGDQAFELVTAFTNPLPPGVIQVDQCDDVFIANPAICENERNELTSLIGATFAWNNLNNPVEPTRGYELRIDGDYAGIGGDVQFFRTTLEAAAHRGIVKGVRASLRLQAGGIISLGDNETLRINNRFFRGGNNFRGFNVAGLGPRTALFQLDENGNETGEIFRGQSLGGQAFYQGTLEVTLPQVVPEQYGIRAALFAEAGGLGEIEDAFTVQTQTLDVISALNAGSALGINTTPIALLPADTQFELRTESGLDLRATAGLSVFWDSPFGPIRFDFSQLITAPGFDRPRGFRFSTNTRF